MTKPAASADHPNLDGLVRPDKRADVHSAQTFSQVSWVGATKVTQLHRYATRQSRPTVDQIQPPEVRAEVHSTGGQLRLATQIHELVGQSFALFSIALTVAEVVIGIAIVLLMYRSHKSIQADAPSTLRG